jgi:hypothetical protein
VVVVVVLVVVLVVVGGGAQTCNTTVAYCIPVLPRARTSGRGGVEGRRVGLLAAAWLAAAWHAPSQVETTRHQGNN